VILGSWESKTSKCCRNYGSAVRPEMMPTETCTRNSARQSTEVQSSLSTRQLKYKNRLNSVDYIKRAELDGTTFCSLEWSENKGSDNSYITAAYNEEAEGDITVVTCIGRIKFMFIARMSDDDPEQVFVSGDWYDIVGENPVSKNVQVKFNPNFDSERLAFLRDCTPKNLTLVPSHPFVDSSPTCLMDVLDD
jgi:hypothetical protein